MIFTLMSIPELAGQVSRTVRTAAKPWPYPPQLPFLLSVKPESRSSWLVRVNTSLCGYQRDVQVSR